VFHCISVQSQWVLVADLFDLDDMYEKDKYESRVWNVTTVMPGFQRYVSVHPYITVSPCSVSKIRKNHVYL